MTSIISGFPETRSPSADAISHVYAEAVRLQVAQLLLTVALPAFSAVVGLLVEQTRPYVAVLAFVVTIADVWWLDRSQRDPMAGNSRIHSRTGLRQIEPRG
jgi:SMODS-associating 4TM effector domain